MQARPVTSEHAVPQLRWLCSPEAAGSLQSVVGAQMLPDVPSSPALYSCVGAQMPSGPPHFAARRQHCSRPVSSPAAPLAAPMLQVLCILQVKAGVPPRSDK
jgi:hypothetical protein